MTISSDAEQAQAGKAEQVGKTEKVSWSDIDKVIEKWLHERQEMILLYCAIDGLKEYTPQETPISVKIQAFCQVLVDYVSAGHFEVYDQLMKEAEQFADEGIEIAKKLYPQIHSTTETALAFNDKYDTEEHCDEQLGSLARDLSALGEQLETRFDLEDLLIEKLHNNHREIAAVN